MVEAASEPSDFVDEGDGEGGGVTPLIGNSADVSDAFGAGMSEVMTTIVGTLIAPACVADTGSMGTES